MVDEENHNGPDHRDNGAIDIESGDAGGAEKVEDQSTHESSDDAEDDVHDHAGPGVFDDLAGDEPGDQAQHQPSDYAHRLLSLLAISWRPIRPSAKQTRIIGAWLRHVGPWALLCSIHEFTPA